MSPRLILEIAFAVIIVGFLIVDLGILNRKAHAISVRAAAWQSIFWITISVIFAWCIFLFYDATKSMEFLRAYATEKMLSVDNLFVILLIFSYFSVEEKYQHRVLFYGILGAIIMRAVFIGLGSVVVSMFHWILYIFGAMLVYAGFKLFFEKKEEHIDFHNNKMYRLAHRLFHFSSNHHGGHFIVREAPRPYGRGISLMRRRKAAAEPGVAGGHFALRASRLHPHSSTGLRPWPPAESGEQGKLFFTTLFLVMVIIEWTDLVFAVDSIPAAFAISQDPFVIYTSNIFAILGLRAMFFLLEAVIHKFHHLQKGLSLVLFVIGAKMLLVMFGIHISSAISFAAVMACLLGSLLLSLLFPKEF